MIYNPPIGTIYHLYTTYKLPIGGLYITYHLLREPGNSIDQHFEVMSSKSDLVSLAVFFFGGGDVELEMWGVGKLD